MSLPILKLIREVYQCPIHRLHLTVAFYLHRSGLRLPLTSKRASFGSWRTSLSIWSSLKSSKIHGSCQMSLSRPTTLKPRPDHLDRQAIIYVRQSTLMQVRANTGSTARQYDLLPRALELGWAREHIRG